jgi:hypothetical protein
MKLNVSREHVELRRLSTQELRAKFAAVFGDGTLSGNRDWLIRRILWRLQELAEGGLSERALRRAEELANDADLRLLPPRPPRQVARREESAAVPGLPMAGTVLTRVYKGETLQVQVLADGFAFEGKTYRSLSAVAKAITRSHTSGKLFFGLQQNGGGR